MRHRHNNVVDATIRGFQLAVNAIAALTAELSNIGVVVKVQPSLNFYKL
jgi:hypothetical protein